MHLSTNLKRLRDQRDLTQDELATRVHLQGGAQIAQYEAGSKTPSLEKALAIAKELGVSLSQLVGEQPQPESVPGQVINHMHGDHQTVYQYVAKACLCGEDASTVLRHLIAQAVREALASSPEAAPAGDGDTPPE